MKKANLITFTGIDGSGKTTQAKLLVENLEKDGIKTSYVWCRWEPFILRPVIRIWKQKKTTNPVAYKEIQRDKESLLENPILRYPWLSLFFIDYGIQIFLRLRLRLFKGGVIVSDRLFYDSLIDQAINLGSRGERFLEDLNSWWMKLIFPTPDIVIYIDCPEEVAFKRKNDAPDIEYLRERRMLYIKLADKYGWIKMDGALPIEVISEEIKNIVYSKLGV